MAVMSKLGALQQRELEKEGVGEAGEGSATVSGTGLEQPTIQIKPMTNVINVSSSLLGFQILSVHRFSLGL